MDPHLPQDYGQDCLHFPRTVDPSQLRRLERLLSEDVSRLMSAVPSIHGGQGDEFSSFMGHLLDEEDGVTTSPFAAKGAGGGGEKRQPSLEEEYEWELRHLGSGWLVREIIEVKGGIAYPRIRAA